MTNSQLTAGVLGVGVIALLADNWRLSRNYKRAQKINEILALQVQSWTYLYRGLMDPSISKEEYAETLRNHVQFLDIIMKETDPFK